MKSSTKKTLKQCIEAQELAALRCRELMTKLEAIGVNATWTAQIELLKIKANIKATKTQLEEIIK